jgi:hypothetical protein
MNIFRGQCGHAPRVLHIGNIANNAYANAKLLIEAGFECDVICYDYYHIMGTPEWEDADFKNTLKDDFYPNWQKVNLNGFVRPKWFVQGPAYLCLAYLHAKNSGNLCRAFLLWRRLGVLNRTQASFAAEWWKEPLSTLVANLSTLVAKLYSYLIKLDTFLSRLHRLTTLESEKLLSLLVKRAEPLVGRFAAILVARGFIAVSDIIYGKVNWLESTGRKFLKFVTASKNRFGGDEMGVEIHNLLIEKWSEKFPEGCIPPNSNDLSAHPANSSKWIRLLKQYDIIIGYSTDPVYPMLANVPYFAFEHGTLRHIPYQNDTQGRLTAAAYHEATHLFVTNFDCVGTAERLGGKRYTFINHPFDDQHGQYVKGGHDQHKQLLKKLDADLLFFHPTRQDWVKGTGFSDKANDVFFKALAKLRTTGYRVAVVCCNWGANVTQTKELIRLLALDAHVEWVPPLPTIPFERMCMAADVVVDQFKLGAFGGVVFKAMAVGAPILTYLNEDLLKEQYPAPPPVINCLTVEDIFDRMVGLICDPASLKSLGEKSRQWISEHHAKGDTVNLQVTQFRKLLDNSKTISA